MRKTGICKKCKKHKKLTKHHIFPSRHFKRRNNHFEFLCRECHDDLETLIPYRKMERWFYPFILKAFLDLRG